MKNIKKWTALFCAGAMAASLLAGCGRGGDAGDSTAGLPEQKEEKKNTAAAEEENTEKSMGRYLEKEMTLPEEISEMVQFPVPYIRKLENGNLMLAEKEAGKYISPDNGETWESEGNPWKDTAKELYVTDMAISPEGAVTMLGIPTIKDSGEGAETGETSGDDTSGDGEGSESETGKDGGGI